MKTIFYTTLILFFSASYVTSQTYTVTGKAYREGETDHSNTKVRFTRTAPGAYTDSVNTNSAGAFSLMVEQGVYTISYTKDGFLPITVVNRPIYADQALPDTTLEAAGLSGNLSGVLSAGTYKVSGNITVLSTDSLHMMPGVRLEFKAGFRLTVQGRLEAVGTASDSIVFTAYDTTQRWDGVWFSGLTSGGSRLSYARVEFSQSGGIRMDDSRATLTHLLVRKNTGAAGIYFWGGPPTLDHLVVADNVSSDGAGILVAGSGTHRITNSLITRNTANGGQGGGGIYCGGASLTLSGVVLSGNTAQRQGSALYSRTSGLLVLENVLMSNNNSGQGSYGGSMCLESSSEPMNVRINNTTVVGEKSGNGIVIYGGVASMSLHNSLIAYNQQRGLYFYNGNSNADIRNSCFYGNPAGNIVNAAPLLGTNLTMSARGDSCDPWYNIKLPPAFVDSINANYRLSTGSSCVNGGVNDSLLSATDLDGSPRLIGRAVDMGCYEMQTVLSDSIHATRQTYTVTGKAYREGETDHSNTKVRFTRTAPGAYTDSVNTNSAGAFSLMVEQGVYTISYTKDGFLPITVVNRPIYADQALPDTTLEAAGLSGNLSGVLSAGTYKVSGNITVLSTDSLHMMPGVRLEFKAGFRLTVQGRLEAVGTASDSIVFTAYDTTQRWDGVWFSGLTSGGSRLSYARVEFSQSGGIRMDDSRATLTHLLVRKNTGTAGIYFWGGPPTLDHLVVADNVSSYDGAGILVAGSGTHRITNSLITRNTANGGQGGGGIYCGGASLTLSGVVLSGNTAQRQGSALYSRTRGLLVLENVLMSNNNSGQGSYGGSMCLESSSEPMNVRINNTTVVGEKSGNGIVIYGGVASMSLHNSLIAYNQQRGLYFYNGNSNADIRNSCFYGNPAGNIVNAAPLLGTNLTMSARGDSCDPWYNIKLPPAFVDSINANYRLSTGSSCVNGGVNDSLLSATDLDGSPRLIGRAVDMGCYEMQTVLSDSIHATRQTYTVTGKAYREGETDHSNTKVRFTRTAPGAYTDSVNTNSAGAFSLMVEQGVYTISYTKDGFLPITVVNRPIYADQALPDTTLEAAGLSGNLSGVLSAGTYKVSGNITVLSTDSLHMMPGVRLEFKAGFRLTVQGRLEAVGTASDSIVFTAYDTTQRWDGVWFSGLTSGGSRLSYARVEFSQSGGIRMDDSRATLTHLLVRKNTGTAGIYFWGGPPTLDHLVVADNVSSDGAGILVAGSGTHRITNSLITRNTANGGQGGGGIYCGGASLTLSGVVLSGNTAQRQGSALYSRTSGLLVLENVLMSNNNSGQGSYGGSMCLESSSEPMNVRINNTTVVGEKSGNGIVIYGGVASMSLHNSLIAYNQQRGLYFYNGNSNADIRNSCFYGNPAGNIVNAAPLLGTNLTVNGNGDSCDQNYNIQLPVRFRDSVNANYHLALGGPCVNAGVNDSLLSATDLDGSPRLIGRAVDMGCYEAQSVLSLNSTVLDFGSTRIGQSRDSIIVLMNAGDEPVAVRSITSSNGAFSASPDTFAIPSMAFATDTLRFTPMAPGDTSGHFVIISNDPASPDTIAVTGFGASYAMTVSRSEINLGTIRVGRGVDSVFTITNTGNAVLVIDSIRSEHPSIVCTPSSMTIAVGASASDTIRFSPATGDSVHGSIVIKGNAVSSPDTIRVEGLGATYGCELSVYDINLGSVRIGLSRDTVVTLTNTGNQPIVVSNITSSLPEFSAFPAQLTISVGGYVLDTLRFAPVTEGQLAAKIIFLSDSLWADTITVVANGSLTGVEEGLGIPKEYTLSQNYPNPFNPSTTIRYGLPGRSMVSLTIYNSIGQQVAVLQQGEKEAGYHSVQFNASHLASGIYFYRLQTDTFVDTKKLLLVK